MSKDRPVNRLKNADLVEKKWNNVKKKKKNFFSEYIKNSQTEKVLLKRYQVH